MVVSIVVVVVAKKTFIVEVVVVVMPTLFKATWIEKLKYLLLSMMVMVAVIIKSIVPL